MSKQFIKLFGERNTGTNYFSRLLNLNLDVILVPGVVPDNFIQLVNERLKAGLLPNIARQLNGGNITSLCSRETLKDIYFSFSYGNNLGWKHSLLHEESLPSYDSNGRRVIYLTITKNPYSWAISLYRRSYEYKGEVSNFEEFLSSPWLTVKRDNAATSFFNPIDMWNQKNKSYRLTNDKFSVLNLRYEDILSNPERIINDITNNFSVSTRPGQFKNLIESTKEKGKSFAYYSDYYLKEEWKKELDSNAIAIINSSLDNEVLEYYRYEMLT